SSSTEQFFVEFWQRYADFDDHSFRSLDEAYDWLGLSEAAPAAVARAIDAGAADAAARPGAMAHFLGGPPRIPQNATRAPPPAPSSDTMADTSNGHYGGATGLRSVEVSVEPESGPHP